MKSSLWVQQEDGTGAHISMKQQRSQIKPDQERGIKGRLGEILRAAREDMAQICKGFIIQNYTMEQIAIHTHKNNAILSPFHHCAK